MKNVIFEIGAISLIFFSCNSEVVHNRIKDRIYKSCVDKLNGQLGEEGDAYCLCAAEEIMKGKTTEEIIKLEKNINEGRISQEQLVAMVQPCIGTLQADVYSSAKEPNSAYRKNFIKSCSDQLKGDNTQNKIDEYCSCSAEAIIKTLTLEELKQLDEDPDDEFLSEKVNIAIQDCINLYKS
jgi:hypothetical protein